MTEHRTRAKERRGALVVAPSPTVLRAGAVWVTIANWAEGIRDVLGRVAVALPEGVLTPEQVRSVASTLFSGPPTGDRVWDGSCAPRALPRQALSRRLAGVLPTWVKTAAKDLRAAAQAAGFARRPLPDLEFDPAFVWQHHDLFQVVGLRWARLLGVPLVVFVDAPQVWEAARWGVSRRGYAHLLERLAERPVLTHADLVLAVSPEVADVLERLGVAGDRMAVAGCRADPRRFTPEIDGTEVREALGLQGRVVVGWVGSFRRFHAVDLLVEALGQVTRHVGEVSLLAVGDGATRYETEALAAELGVHAVFPGAVPHEEVPRYLAAMDLAVLPARSADEFHYSPLKLREYMAAGLPVVAAEVGETSRVMTDGVDGVLVEPGSVTALAAAVAKLCQDSGSRAELGRAARRRALEETVERDVREVLGRLGL
ncbi:MAG: hypothetical protein KatS3mg008_0021 [Acidimicrobiales bacterium]|nr:MAG: hypothetical protein KatS3mg008_0021 [Acidimicrobiales bacterium]